MTFKVSTLPDARVSGWIGREAEKPASVIDLGCGLAEYSFSTGAGHVCGLDSFQPYIDQCEATFAAEGARFECGDVLDYDAIFDHPHECALLIDVIEHLEKPKGVELLEKLKKTCRVVLVFTPLGWYEQGDVDDNPAQKHVSAWLPSDLGLLGFSVTVDFNFHSGNPPETRGAIYAVWRKP